MGIDINAVHQFARALAIGQRNEQNRRHPGSRDSKHETWEETNRNAAKITIALLMIAFIIKILIKFLRYLGRMSIKAFGPKWGRVINVLGSVVIVLFVPTCSILYVDSYSGAVTTNDIYQQQRDKREAKEREEIKAYKESVRSEVEKEAKARGIEGERLDLVLNTFDGKVNAYSTGNAISKESAEARIDRSKRECWEKLPEHDAPLIEAYLEQRTSEFSQQTQIEIKQIARQKHLGIALIFEDAKAIIDKEIDEAIEKIKRQEKEKESIDKINKYLNQKLSEVEQITKDRYLLEQIEGLKYGGRINTTVFEDAKAIIDKQVNKTIMEIKRQEKKKESIDKINKYLNQKLSEVEQITKDRYLLEQIEGLKYGGRINTTVFEDAKALIDKKFNEAIREIDRQEKEDESINRIREYLDQKLSDVKQVAKVRIEKLKRSGHWEKVGFVEYQVRQVADLCIYTTAFEDAKAIIDKAVNNAIKEIEKY